MQSFSVKSKYCFISGIHLYGACAASYPSAGEEVFHMADNFTDHTQTFNFEALQQPDMQQILTLVYDALKEKGYNPISQIVGYILSEDPTYITTHNNARSLIRKIDRDELMQELVQFYLDN